MVCDPNIYGGNFVQTLFLGATIVNYTATLGWNSNPSEVQIILVEDSCSSAAGKLYYDGCLNPQIHYGPDYFNPPLLGYPVYFKFGSFSFSGILQNYKYITSDGGRKINVRLVAPVEILSGTSVILGGYNGPVYNIPNLLNVYSFLEWYYGVSSPVSSQLTNFLSYTPVQNFGGSLKNDAGIPWHMVKDSLSLIVNSSITGIFGRRLMLRGNSFNLDISELPNLDYSFRMGGDNKDLLTIISEICELSGLDFIVSLVFNDGNHNCEPHEYSEVSDIAGRVSDNIQAWIKISTVSRINQPLPAKMIDQSVDVPLEDRLNQGAIYNYIQGETPTNLDRGIELRTDNTNAMTVGDYRQDVFQIPYVSQYNDIFSSTIWPFYGLDDNGFPLQSGPKSSTASQGYFDHCVFIPITHKFDPISEALLTNFITNELGDYALPIYRYSATLPYSFTVGLPALGSNLATYWTNLWGYTGTPTNVAVVATILNNYNSLLYNYQCYSDQYIYSMPTLHTLYSDSTHSYYYPVDYAELLAALISEDTWQSFLFATQGQNNKYKMMTAADPYKLGTTIMGDLNGLHDLLYRSNKHKADHIKNTDWSTAVRTGTIDPSEGLGTGDSQTPLNKLYSHISKIAQEFFGKKFLVKVPDIKAIVDASTAMTIKINTDITRDGWTDAPYVLTLTNGSLQLSLFRNTENGKLFGFAYFVGFGGASNSFLDTSEFTQTDVYQPTNNEAFIKFTVEEIIFVDPLQKKDARLVISFTNPVFTSYTVVDNTFPLAPVLTVWDWKKGLGAYFTKVDPVIGPLVGEDTVNVPMLPLSMPPLCLAIPTKSNELSYGPWVAMVNGQTMIVDANKTDYIKESDLNPWNYGGTTYMNSAGQISVNTKIVQQNIVEFGNFTLPGLPRFSLASVAIVNGPQITDFSINFGTDGMTTTYGMRTFTPNYGALGKNRMDAIKKMGTNIQKNVTMTQQALASSTKNWKSMAGNPLIRLQTLGDRNTRTSSSSFLLADSQIRYEPSGILISGGINYNGSNITTAQYKALGGSVYPTLNTVNSVVTTDFRKCLPELQGNNDAVYQTRAGMSIEGLLRPYSTYTEDFTFSHFATGINSFVGSGDMIYRGSMNASGCYDYSNNFSRFGTPPVSGIGQPPIHWGTMNPFLEGSGLVMDPHVSGFGLSMYFKGHDIEYVIRDGTYPVDLSVHSPYDNYSTSGWYRAVGIKTPLILVGWGYDIDGYPVPNKYGETNRGATFEDDWLRKPHHWKSGPLDVRWDQNRGVWTVPVPFSIVRIQATQTAPSSGTFTALLSNSISAFTPSGTIITSGNIIVHNVVGATLGSGQFGYAMYNPNDYYSDINYSKYELLAAGSASTIKSFILRTDLIEGGCALAEETTMNGATLTANGNFFAVYDRAEEFYGYTNKSCGLCTNMTDTPSLSGAFPGWSSGTMITDSQQLREIIRLTCPTFNGCPCATA
jgi:hypothetical protein